MSLASPAFWTALVILAAVVLGIVRLILWQRSAGPARAARWRLMTLIGLQVLAGAMLWLTLHPPASPIRTGTMIVATAGSPATIAAEPGDILIALPEAGPVTDATRVPDLATALRRYPTPARIRIIGQGLTPRDQSPLPVPVEFSAPPLPRGLIDLALPEPTAPGATFVVGGQVGTLAAGTLELVDPADVVVDRARIASGQRFALMAAVHAPGLALFDLRLRDASGAVVERIAVPVETLAPTPPRVLVLAGAPSAETKYLKRWAEESRIALTLDIDIGGGIQLGDAPIALNAATLDRLDLVILDDRRWENLAGGQRAALTAAVNNGMGLLLRPTGPLSAATRRDWAGLGLNLSGGDDAVPLRLAPTAQTAAPDDTAPVEPTDDAEASPELARRDLTITGSEAIALLRDADGVALASWRARGRGRVGVWTVTDSYALVLTGRPDQYGEMWSALFSQIGRAGEDSRAELSGVARVGTRVALCHLLGQPRVLGQDGRVRSLRIDPAAGDRACAAYWPNQAGWHVVQDDQRRETPFYVHPIEDAPSLEAANRRSVTEALASLTPARTAPDSTSHAPGSPWPWFCGLLFVLSGLWWLERNRDPGVVAHAVRFWLKHRKAV
ncbi:hypothetical protein KOAAANKH_02900 [Brevundimonas sp. NIBR10]|uniref:hypothetical protein n=1 Tax=Brevundimonas sp. NIBR10 TaxID=3015997 RepID=UPI0022F152FD|nr:hypothetical protein [Brevundimonas sp. NIBR10]WGM48012.1 hypothetical protein KOAAANKH_02900 [Brevundimonas sp. NIBR10]